MTRHVKVALTIAGSDSGGGAGIQADLKTFAALGVFGTCAITAITAQNTRGVTAAQALPADLVTAQIEAVASDFHVAATKTGMLASAAIVEAVAAAISELQLPLVVVDPVMVAKSGDRLMDDDALTAMKGELLRRALVVTPNIPEAEVLSGRSIRNLDEAKAAAERIHRLGPSAVVVKGGHGQGDDLIDLLFDGSVFHTFSTPRVATRNTHGTGCTFASAIAARLALGDPLVDAVRRAQAYVAGAIRHGLAIGHGHGPLDHFWNSTGLYT
ncbi:MAG: bifunctional hydroxymethylpyrimidine kinase/phosphomethylpyrimidine kinase [Acidobacteria bacterium]|nr:bifunctional hydroxymethylpyrimidine kinase/phosphomethylpyrimidine kinase [Acidobacteriota bacterium]